MGYWEYIYSAIDSVKRNAPDLSSVKNLCWSSYDYSRSAVTKIHGAVAGSAVAEKLYQHLPDEEARSKMATNLAKKSASVAVQEGLKFVPGGLSVYSIVSGTLQNDKKSKEYKEMLELKNKVDRLDKELSDYRKLLEETEIRKRVMGQKRGLELVQKPEDLIRIFMMTEFMGNHFLDNLIVPGVRSNKKHSK